MPTAVSRAVIEVLLDRVSQGVCAISPDGTIAYANQRFAAMLGLSRGLLFGQALSSLAAEADRELLSATLAAGHEGAAQCAIAFARTGVRALLAFAPLGHGQASCIATALPRGEEPVSPRVSGQSS